MSNRNRPAYWRHNHLEAKAADGVDAARVLADIARDHPDWSDEQVLAQLQFETG